MDIVTLLEKLANSTHLKINDVLTLFPNDVRDALLKNNPAEP